MAVEPGSTLPYEEADWLDALVMVKAGAIVLETLGGRSWRFGPGDLLWLQGLPLAALHNRGEEPTLLVAATRKEMA